MLMVFVSTSVSCEQPWALEIAEAPIVRKSHVFFHNFGDRRGAKENWRLLPDRRGIFSYC
jgi:hypothetical protein